MLQYHTDGTARLLLLINDLSEKQETHSVVLFECPLGVEMLYLCMWPWLCGTVTDDSSPSSRCHVPAPPSPSTPWMHRTGPGHRGLALASHSLVCLPLTLTAGRPPESCPECHVPYQVPWPHSFTLGLQLSLYKSSRVPVVAQQKRI